jgi:hypothetical protein
MKNVKLARRIKGQGMVEYIITQVSGLKSKVKNELTK